MIINVLQCGACHKSVKYKDRTFLDIANTVIHQKCYDPTKYIVKDRGTFQELVERYTFFEDFKRY